MIFISAHFLFMKFDRVNIRFHRRFLGYVIHSIMCAFRFSPLKCTKKNHIYVSNNLCADFFYEILVLCIRESFLYGKSLII